MDICSSSQDRSLNLGDEGGEIDLGNGSVERTEIDTKGPLLSYHKNRRL